jgi:hypothetical protein
MDINICNNCKYFKKFPIRYRCNKYHFDVKHHRYNFKTSYPEELYLKETFLKRSVPAECPSHLNERNSSCFSCPFCFTESVRLKCTKNMNSWSYDRIYKKENLSNNYNYFCPYEFEQEISELNS